MVIEDRLMWVMEVRRFRGKEEAGGELVGRG